MGYNFDANHLEAFRLVIELGSVSRAAERLRVSQPAVTKVMLRLEERLGFPLFEHGRGRTVPTPEALQFYESAAIALTSIERVAEVAQEIRQRQIGSIQIISHPMGATAVLPPVITAFRKSHPGVYVRVQTRNSPQLRELLPSQAFDLGLAEPPIDGRLSKTLRQGMASVCVLPPGHQLSRKDFVTPADLSGYPLIVPGRDRPLHHALHRAFEDMGAAWNVSVEADLGITVGELVLHGIGAAVLDPLTASLFESRGLVTRRFKPTMLYEFVVFQPQRQASLITTAFLNSLKAFLRPHQHLKEAS